MSNPLAETGGVDFIDVRSPYDGQLLARVEQNSREDIEQALSVAHALFADRRVWLSKQMRLGILRRAAELVAERREDLARQVAAESGKPYRDALVEVDRGMDGLRLCVETLRTRSGHVVPMDLDTTSAHRVAFTQYEPIGVVVGISAFNHPFNLVVHQVAPAIAVGAPVLIKPSEKTPLSCLALLDIFRDAGLPTGWAQAMVTADHAAIGALAADPRIGFLTFIGSARVGWTLRSRLAPGTRCALEHGGVAPVIVSEDADLDAALPSIARAAFWHAGQACVSTQRIFAHRSIARIVAEKLARLGDAMTIGDPLSPSTEVGPLISAAEADRVEAWVVSAIAGGATLVGGGRRLSPSCYANTVLLEPRDDAEVTCEEVFGPVACVYAWDDLDEALARANALPFAFQTAVFTRQLETAMHCYRGLAGSAVMVNDNTLFRVDWMPFAGARQSGLGVGGIPATMQDMQTEKMMVWRQPYAVRDA